MDMECTLNACAMLAAFGVGVVCGALIGGRLQPERGRPPVPDDSLFERKQSRAAADGHEIDSEVELFFKALRIVECGDVTDPPDGDGGKAIGPYQIHHGYWRDAAFHAAANGRGSSIYGGHGNCRMENYARRVVTEYLNRYAPGALRRHLFWHAARIHNGGPNGDKKRSTMGYADRVILAMRGLRAAGRKVKP